MNKKLSIIILFFTILFSSDNNYQLSLNQFSSRSSLWWQENNNSGNNLSGGSLDIQFEKRIKGFSIFLDSSVLFDTNNIFVNDFFINYAFKNNLNIKAGRFKREFSKYLNDRLSSGSILMSGNAQPIPRVSLTLSKPIKRNKNIIFDMGISHGIFDKNEFYSDPPYLHEKFIYMIFTNQEDQFGVGLVHEAMWGGTTTQGKHTGKQPDNFSDFLKVLISADGPLREGEPHANALGNHLGIWDFYYIKKLKESELKFYYQHFFEDTSSFRFANKNDGLWGIEISDKKQKFLIEYINTTNACSDPPYQCDNYYWNYQYASGWRYKGNSIGNPLINPENSIYIDQIKAAHLGLQFKLRSYQINILALRKINIYDEWKTLFRLRKDFSSKVTLDLIGFRDGNESSFGLNLNYAF